MDFDQNYIFGLCATIKIKLWRTPVFGDFLILHNLEVWITRELPDWTLLTSLFLGFNHKSVLALCAKFQPFKIKNKGAKNPSLCKCHHSPVWRTLEVPDGSLMIQNHVYFDQNNIFGLCANFQPPRIKNKGAKNPPSLQTSSSSRFWRFG